ncbi:MAG: VPLPA-CTERM sorting domain-containing protein [Gammaproteobacteria bacterium]
MRKIPALFITFLAVTLCCTGVKAASQLTYDSEGHVVGYSLPGITPAGSPNFENYASIRLIEKGPGGNNGYLVMGSLMEGSKMYFNIGVANGVATNSYEVLDPTYSLFGNFTAAGDTLGKRNFIEITGTIDDLDFGTYSGVLMTADLTKLVVGEDLIGMNTGNIVCPFFDFCTENESAYINLDTGLAVTTVPLPGAAWLFGSGLLGLTGIARRKKVT